MHSGNGNTESLEVLTPRRWLWILISIIILGAVGVFLLTAKDTVDVSQVTEPAPAPYVSVVRVSVEAEAARVEVFGEVQPRWSAEIRAAVAGRINRVEDRALAGERVSVGQTLFEIDKTRYEADVANAELALEQAKLSR